MNSEWKNFLSDNGAELKQTGVNHFGNPKRERQVASTGDIFCDLSHLSQLEVSGADSADFLHSLFTNDIHALKVGDSQLNGWCTPKGRMIALFYTLRSAEDTFQLLYPAEQMEGLEKRLQMFILRAKVTLTNRSDTALRIGLSGSDAERQLAPLINPLPHAVDSAVSASSLTVVRIHPALYPRFLLLIDDIEQAKEVWGHLDVQATAVGHAPWELLNIRAGIPAVFSATQEAFIPQMVNLQAINGLSFNKGCYPGQEVVARMEYLGQLKRTMYHITTPATCSPHAGDTLYAASSSSAQGAGKIISIEMNGDGGWEGLAVVEVTAAESNDLTLDQEGTIKLTVQAPKTA